MAFYEEPVKKLPVKESDVVIAGGGTAGVVAALASARQGARTALIEAKGCPGGTVVEGGTAMLKLNLCEVPFSRFSSYLAISRLEGEAGRPEGIHLRSVGGGRRMGEIFRLQVTQNGDAIPFKEEATATLLRFEAAGGRVMLCMPDPDVLRVYGEGAGLRLTMHTGAYDNAFALPDGRWQVICASQDTKLMLIPVSGGLSVEARWGEYGCDEVIVDLVPDAAGTCDMLIEAFESGWNGHETKEDFAAAVKRAADCYGDFLGCTLPVPERYAAARELAAYVNWSAVVGPKGHFTRPAMFMSKNWMNNVWSWDHCFNAMALAKENPELAWDQYMVLFDHQHADGALPDCVNDRNMIWSFCKPPIHGWALSWMMRRNPLLREAARLAEVYEPLSRWTRWWFRYRDSDADGIPEYHHGNDSGWDNSTVFQIGSPVEGPDLSAFLILQMETLSEAADILGKQDEARQWQTQAAELLQKLIAHSWRGDRFVAPRAGTHDVFTADSLFLYLPIVLGPRLPEGVRRASIAGLKEDGRFLTEYGLATESPRSSWYQPDGYWRGPIWAPSTMLIVDGLMSLGEKSLAREIARRFCDMAARNGMAENFDALTGVGLRDMAYTWTSSVFLILAHEYV